MIPYRAMLDVPAELLRYLSRLLAAERRRRCTPAGSRRLTCREQAILALRWFRDRTRIEALGRDHAISRATAYRYVAEAVDVLSAQAPGLPEALDRALAEGLPYVILDGKVFASDRCSEPATSVKGEQIDAWYSGKARRHGGNVQAVMRPDGLPRVSWKFVDRYLEQTLATPGWWRTLSPAEQAAITRQFWEVGRLTLEWWLTPRQQVDRFTRRPGTSVISVVAEDSGAARVRLKRRHRARRRAGPHRGCRRVPGARRHVPGEPPGPLPAGIHRHPGLRPVLWLHQGLPGGRRACHPGTDVDVTAGSSYRAAQVLE